MTLARPETQGLLAILELRATRELLVQPVILGWLGTQVSLTFPETPAYRGILGLAIQVLKEIRVSQAIRGPRGTREILAHKGILEHPAILGFKEIQEPIQRFKGIPGLRVTPAYREIPGQIPMLLEIRV